MSLPPAFSTASVCTVIVDHDRHEDTLACLESLAGSGFIGSWILIANGSAEPLAGLPPALQAEVIRLPENLGFVRAFNLGIRVAQGDTLAFIDADCVVEQEWLAYLLDAVKRGSQVLSGAIEFDADNYWATAYNLSMFHEFLASTPAGSRNHLPSMNLLALRSVIETVGLFNEALARGQDTELTVRMREHGYRLDFVPQARVWHRHARRTAREIWNEWLRGGAYSAEIRLQHSGSLAAPSLIRYPALIRLLAPFIAFAVTMNIYLRNPATLRYLFTGPAVYLTKLAWCVGAARRRTLKAQQVQ